MVRKDSGLLAMTQLRGDAIAGPHHLVCRVVSVDGPKELKAVERTQGGQKTPHRETHGADDTRSEMEDICNSFTFSPRLPNQAPRPVEPATTPTG